MRSATQLYVTPLFGWSFKSSNIYANCFTLGCVVITDNTANFLSVCERQREMDAGYYSPRCFAGIGLVVSECLQIYLQMEWRFDGVWKYTLWQLKLMVFVTEPCGSEPRHRVPTWVKHECSGTKEYAWNFWWWKGLGGFHIEHLFTNTHTDGFLNSKRSTVSCFGVLDLTTTSLFE